MSLREVRYFLLQMVESLLYNGDKMKEVADGIRADLDEVQSLFFE